MDLKHAASISDLRTMAKRRLPQFAFDFIDGGAEDEHGLRRNQTAFDAIEMVPRYLRDMSMLDHETELFGKSYAVPFGMAPVGALNLAWPGSDLAMARLAAKKRMILALSGNSSTAIEPMAEACEGHMWFQSYMTQDVTIREMLLSRAEAAGVEVLIVTVDIPRASKRDRDTRSGLVVPFQLTPSILLDLILHPRWSPLTRQAGSPNSANLKGTSLEAASRNHAEFQARLISSSFDWDALQKIRDRWKGKLLVKGILHPEDAEFAVEGGMDGIIVSNHGGRQADYGPATIAVLPAIAKAVAGRIPIGLDSGIRRGHDVIRAKALGADFVLCGRAFAYGAAAGGAAGCERAYDLIEKSFLCAMGQLGCARFAEIDTRILATSVPVANDLADIHYGLQAVAE
ncbi:MAG: alpha-hydroxy acid oxidase [Pseudomonadota bacterium]